MRPLLPPRCRPPPRNLWTSRRPVRPTSITAGPGARPQGVSPYTRWWLRRASASPCPRGLHAAPTPTPTRAPCQSAKRTSSERAATPLPGPPCPSAAAAAETGAASAANETPTRGRCFPAEAGPCRSPRPCRPLPARFRHLAPRYEETWFAYFAENTVAVDPSSVRSCTKLSASQWNCHYSNELAQDPTPHRAPRPALPEDMSRERPFASDLSFPCPSTFLPRSRGCPRSPAA